MTPHRDRSRATFALGLWLAFLMSILVALHGIGGGLAPPPLTHPRDMGQWLDERQPAEAAFAVLRLATLGMAWYLLAATVASILARLSRLPEAVRVADVFTLPLVRHVANAAAGLSVAAGLSSAIGVATNTPGPWPPRGEVMALVSEAHAAAGRSTATVTNLNEPGTDTTTPAPTTSDDEVEPLPTLRRLPDEPPVPPPQATSSEATPAPPPPTPPPPPSLPLAEAPSAAPEVPQSPARWEVQPGEHFWSVAERLMAAAWRLPASDAEIDRYWRRLIEANRAILRDPANPDLLYPGQVLTIPPPPPTPSGHPNP